MATQTNASRAKAAHVAKFVAQHREYCVQFTQGDPSLLWFQQSTGKFFTEAEYNKLVNSHLMTMTTRILKACQ